MRNVPPNNRNVADFNAYKRYRDAASRCEPLASGRRDPHRGPDRYVDRPDPYTVTALDLLREMWRDPNITPEQRAALSLAGQALRASVRGAA